MTANGWLETGWEFPAIAKSREARWSCCSSHFPAKIIIPAPSFLACQFAKMKIRRWRPSQILPKFGFVETKRHVICRKKENKPKVKLYFPQFWESEGRSQFWFPNFARLKTQLWPTRSHSANIWICGNQKALDLPKKENKSKVKLDFSQFWESEGWSKFKFANFCQMRTQGWPTVSKFGRIGEEQILESPGIAEMGGATKLKSQIFEKFEIEKTFDLPNFENRKIFPTKICQNRFALRWFFSLGSRCTSRQRRHGIFSHRTLEGVHCLCCRCEVSLSRFFHPEIAGVVLQHYCSFSPCHHCASTKYIHHHERARYWNGQCDRQWSLAGDAQNWPRLSQAHSRNHAIGTHCWNHGRTGRCHCLDCHDHWRRDHCHSRRGSFGRCERTYKQHYRECARPYVLSFSSFLWHYFGPFS